MRPDPSIVLVESCDSCPFVAAHDGGKSHCTLQAAGKDRREPCHVRADVAGRPSWCPLDVQPVLVTTEVRRG